MADPSDPLDLSRPPPGRKVNILLVDDQPANLLTLEAVLEDLGQNLVRASSGEEALRRLPDADFAVILLDVRMHGLDGFETAKRVRAHPERGQTPIIFLTAHDDDRLSALEAYALGAVDYLTKPLQPVILRAKVAGFVELFEKTEQVKRQAEQIRQMERRIFERKLAEENARLRESEGRFARFMQHLPGLAWVKDADGRYVYVNDAAARVFGVSPAEVPGKTDDDLFPPETAAQFKANDRRALAAGVGMQVVESLRHADGVVHHSIVSKFPIPRPEGGPALVGGVAFDITERRQMEEALREADRRKDEFLAMLAHELRNPLAPIRNALHVLKMPGSTGETALRLREMAERQVKHMARLLDDLLDVSRISRGRIELRQEVVDVPALVRHTLEAVGPLMEEQRHELDVSLPAEPVRVKGDPARLEQVLTNLLNNAAKYTDPGGHITLAVASENGEAVLRVRDTGVGIAPEMLPKIFDLFVQAERRLDRAPGGVGIGLTLVRKLVEMHGGRVDASSPGLGGGSEFVVRLPALADATGATGGLPASASPSTGGQAASGTSAVTPRRVLVVDDNHDAADSLALLLRLEGQEVRVAYDGPSALAVAGEFRPALAFVDIGMPGMDGHEVARHLRRQPDQKDTLLVALTGWGQEEDRRRSAAAGFDQHLVKPVEPDALRAVLADLKRAQR